MAATAEWGAPQIVVANAGAAESRPFLKTDAAAFRAALDVNLTGVFATWQAGLAPMLAAGWGRLIAIASTAGLKGYAYVTAYCAAKHGVIGLTRALALETARTGVTVNASAPATPAPRCSSARSRRSWPRPAARAPRPRRRCSPRTRSAASSSPAEVAATVLWLCGDGAASVTGQAISISGGET